MAAVNCPICRKALPEGGQKPPPRPFCSERCRTIDMASWLTGSYAVAGEPVDLESQALSAADEQALREAQSEKGR